MFNPIFGDIIQFDEHIFQIGWNHQLDDDYAPRKLTCYQKINGWKMWFLLK